MDISKRIWVIGNGNQAPYGIGEIIETFANTEAGLKKANKYTERWYNSPSVRTPKDRELLLTGNYLPDELQHSIGY